MHCQITHTLQCLQCKHFIEVANKVITDGYCLLPTAFRMLTPGGKYTAEHARRLVLQMRLVAICVGDPKKGNSFTILMETFPETDYCKIGTIISGLANTTVQHMVGLERPVVKMLLSVAKSDRIHLIVLEVILIVLEVINIRICMKTMLFITQNFIYLQLFRYNIRVDNMFQWCSYH